MNIEFNVMLQNTWKWKHYTKQVTKVLSIAQQKHRKSCLKICKYNETIYHPSKILKSWCSGQDRSSFRRQQNHDPKILIIWSSSSLIVPKSINNSTNDLDPTNVPKIQKPKLVRKLGRNDIKWSNPYGDQVTHFTSYTKSFNAKFFYCNHKKKKNHIWCKTYYMCIIHQ